jgi:hypothetical protein
MQKLMNADRSPMCWELGHFQAPRFATKPSPTPARPYMLVCLDKASTAIMGCDRVQTSPSSQDLLTLLIASMENPLLGGVPVLPTSVHLDDPRALEPIRTELGELSVKVSLVKRLSGLHEFKKIVGLALFSRRGSIREGQTDGTNFMSAAAIHADQ